MPRTAIDGTYEHPGIPGAMVTAGASHLVGWANQHCSRPRPGAVDIETFGVGVDGLRIKSVAVAFPSTVAVFDPRDPFQHKILADILAGLPQLVFHTSTFDVPSMVYNRIVPDTVVNKVHDIVISARMAEPGDLPPKTLEALSHRYLGMQSDPITNTFKVLGYSKKEGFRKLDIDSPVYLFGNAADAIATARLQPILRQAAYDQLTVGHPFSPLQPQRQGWAWEEVDKHQRFNQITLRRTVKGLRIDEEFLDRYRQKNGQAIREAEKDLVAIGVKPGNPNSIAAKLEELGALPPDHPKTPKGKTSTKAEDLEVLQHPIARKFVEHKRLVKVDVDYLNKCMELARPDSFGDLRIHPETSILKAAHGRTSMGGPPIHQFPEPARGIVLPDRGDELASTDWAQQEPVIGLNLAGDVDALADYEARGKKIYDFVSSIARVPYKPAKVVVLGGMYGEGLKKLSADLNLDPGPYVQRVNRKTGEMETVATYAAARDLHHRIFGDPKAPGTGALPATGMFLQRLRTQARQIQKVVTINGRVLPIPSGFYDGEFSVQAHKGPNYEICGSATDQWVDTVLELDRRGLTAGLYFGMHDEGITSAHIRREMQQIMEIPPEGLVRMARRNPKIRTDSVVLGERWDAA